MKKINKTSKLIIFVTNEWIASPAVAGVGFLAMTVRGVVRNDGGGVWVVLGNIKHEMDYHKWLTITRINSYNIALYLLGKVFMNCLVLFNKDLKMIKIQKQVTSIYFHIVNLVVNMFLGNDIASCSIRVAVLKLSGCNIGKGTTIKGGCYFYGNKIETGKDCFINRDCYFDFSAPIKIGDDVGIGHGVTFVTAEHEIGSSERRTGKNISAKPINIGSGSWIGANATILPNVTIGEGAIIAAGALVNKDVAANTMVGGVPAKVIKTLE